MKLSKTSTPSTRGESTPYPRCSDAVTDFLTTLATADARAAAAEEKTLEGPLLLLL